MPDTTHDTLDLVAGDDAFGDGTHPTTELMLAAIEALEPASFQPRTACDMGCGSGLLALRIAQRFGCHTVAVDIEKTALQATQQNAQANGLEGCITTVHSDGFHHPDIIRHAPFDMMVINILAEPLLQHARGAVDALAPEGVLMLSGILKAQEEQISAAYQKLNCHLLHRLQLDDWVALVLEKAAVS